MRNYWFISDTHFNQKSIIEFKNYDGTSLRPFKSVEEMNETIIDNWNNLIKPQDKVYHLGDVIMGNRTDYDKILSRLNGKKRLILGNHDVNKEKNLIPYFNRISGIRDLNINGFKCILSHIPLHPNCLDRFGNINIHGHLHNNYVLNVKNYNLYLDKTIEVTENKYINVCVEKTDYKPINLEEIKEKYE